MDLLNVLGQSGLYIFCTTRGKATVETVSAANIGREVGVSIDCFGSFYREKLTIKGFRIPAAFKPFDFSEWPF